MKVNGTLRLIILCNIIAVAVLGIWFWGAINGKFVVYGCMDSSPMTVLESITLLVNAPSAWVSHTLVSLLAMESSDLSNYIWHALWATIITPQWLAYIALWRFAARKLTPNMQPDKGRDDVN